MDKRIFLFKSVNLITIIAVYLLILVGGVVRNLGAGMGCPDWPKCFGKYVPPTEMSELPANYQEIFAKERLRKNERLASTLASLGWVDLASKIRNDPKISQETAFSVTKAWVEYINRLIGVLIGLLIILNFWFSLRIRKESKWLPLAGGLALVLVIFQGWVGSLVVSTNLLPGFITFHMLLALVLVAVLLYQQFLVSKRRTYQGNKWVVLILLVLTIIQTVLGTGVRESIDLINAEGVPRHQWVEALGNNFYIHRSFSIIVLLVSGFFFYQERKTWMANPLLFGFALVLLLEIGLGAVMYYFDMPGFAQPLHLLLGTIMFGVIFYLFLDFHFKTRLV